jgi:hypothetical protein
MRRLFETKLDAPAKASCQKDLTATACLNFMRGLLKCARYAFAPNKLKYCGPADKNFQLFSYIAEDIEDQGLNELLGDFAVMYPYLKLIAEENGIGDSFDERVVEAYWIGNELLEGVSLKSFWEHLMAGQRLKERFREKDLKWIVGKVPAGAKVHHSFHVFNVWNRTGHEAKPHTVKTMDSCRISAGEILQKDQFSKTNFQKNAKLQVKTDRLVYRDGKLGLERKVIKEVSWRLGDKSFVKSLQPGDWVTIHWGWVCEKVTRRQVKNLEKYTKWHLKLANLTI